jgi:hypothetical protein
LLGVLRASRCIGIVGVAAHAPGVRNKPREQDRMAMAAMQLLCR